MRRLSCTAMLSGIALPSFHLIHLALRSTAQTVKRSTWHDVSLLKSYSLTPSVGGIAIAQGTVVTGYIYIGRLISNPGVWCPSPWGGTNNITKWFIPTAASRSRFRGFRLWTSSLFKNHLPTHFSSHSYISLPGLFLFIIPVIILTVQRYI